MKNPKETNGREYGEVRPTRRALQHLFMEGKIMVSYREGFQKVYDLTERVLPEHTDQKCPSRSDYIQHLIDRDLRSHGIVAENEIGYLLTGYQKEIATQLSHKVESKELLKIKIEGSQKAYYAKPETLQLTEQRFTNRVKILSPFDNLLINRHRAKEIFDFDYLLECYVPADKRKFGYFALPILWKNELIGQIDAKADRKKHSLLIKKLELKPMKLNDVFVTQWRKTLASFMEFNGVYSVKSEVANLNQYTRDALFSLPSK